MKKEGFKWTKEVEQAFQDLKTALVTTPELALSDFNQQFVMECDALETGVGEVLMQNQHPIAFFSKALQGRSKYWQTYE